MKRRRHTREQIIAKLREADALLGSGATLGHACRKLGIRRKSSFSPHRDVGR